MISITDEGTFIKLEYATTKYHNNAIWFDMGKGKSQINATSLKQQLNSYEIVYEECPIFNFHIVFVDECGDYVTTFDSKRLNCRFLYELTINNLNEFLEDNKDLFVEKLEIILIKPLKYQSRKIKTKKKSNRRKTNIPRGLRKEVFKRDNYTCRECGAKKGDKKADGSKVILHVDHILPVSKGGSDMLENLQTLCADCNLNKSNLIQ